MDELRRPPTETALGHRLGALCTWSSCRQHILHLGCLNSRRRWIRNWSYDLFVLDSTLSPVLFLDPRCLITRHKPLPISQSRKPAIHGFLNEKVRQTILMFLTLFDTSCFGLNRFPIFDIIPSARPCCILSGRFSNLHTRES